MSGTGDKRKSSTGRKSSGDKDRRTSGIPPRPPGQQAGRHLSVGAAGNIVDYDDDFFEDDEEMMTPEQLRRRVISAYIFSV